MTILAIDPGPVESAYVVYLHSSRQPIGWAKVSNEKLLGVIDSAPSDYLVAEMIASYGMAVGQDVFETCVWIGRFIERWTRKGYRRDPLRVYRREVKLHLCDDSRARDSNIRQALIDRWGGKEQAIGRKATPGPLYGISGDVWQALGVAVTAAHSLKEERT